MDIKIDTTNTKINTERLLLRAWKQTDLNDFFEYASVEGVGENAGWPHHESIETTQNVLQSFLSKKNEWAIVYKANKKVIGSVGLLDAWANNEPGYAHLTMKEIGYVLSKDYWGQGIMPEAVKAVIDFCFYKLKLDAVTSGHSVQNTQSRRVIEKCGLQYVTTRESVSQNMQRSFYGMKYILLNPTKQ